MKLQFRGDFLDSYPCLQCFSEDFRDIDATQAWGLTLLFGSRRIRCDVPAIEGQCLIGEMIDALRGVGALPFFAINDEEE